jgi:hypothetical protein
MYVSPATINESPRRSKRPEAGQKSEWFSRVGDVGAQAGMPCTYLFCERADG